MLGKGHYLHFTGDTMKSPNPRSHTFNSGVKSRLSDRESAKKEHGLGADGGNPRFST